MAFGDDVFIVNALQAELRFGKVLQPETKVVRFEQPCRYHRIEEAAAGAGKNLCRPQHLIVEFAVVQHKGERFIAPEPREQFLCGGKGHHGKGLFTQFGRRRFERYIDTGTGF